MKSNLTNKTLISPVIPSTTFLEEHEGESLMIPVSLPLTCADFPPKSHGLSAVCSSPASPQSSSGHCVVFLKLHIWLRTEQP